MYTFAGKIATISSQETIFLDMYSLVEKVKKTFQDFGGSGHVFFAINTDLFGMDDWKLKWLLSGTYRYHL